MLMVCLGLGLVLLGIWEIREGRADFSLFSRLLRRLYFDREENPVVFWLCVVPKFLLALLCFLLSTL